MSAKKPRLVTRCEANRYSGPRERIVELAGETDEQGGLVSLSFDEDGKLRVVLYNLGADVVVEVKNDDEPETTPSVATTAEGC